MKIPRQVYQLWICGHVLSENTSLQLLLKFAKEQIQEEAWDISERDYRKVILIRTETMEFNFEAYMKGTGLKRGKTEMKCKNCKGSGVYKIPGKGGTILIVECGDCNGSGKKK
jgi:excinuclease UvrABC ATPase subunit